MNWNIKIILQYKRSFVEKCCNIKYTLASKGIYACGVLPRRTMKQEKLGLHLSSIEGECLESQALAFRRG
jgi:hypothetical protein